ncbi:TonB family protein [Halosquirtibacter xylanolyticus]|uniref:energy transducer TonB n=1 Tax=Halosquirtibacter xylanolyticus TaxID=3374599 RepID=UPI003749145B|nr:TonB family protein [Prolixibacteraceae bacterium]
MKKSLPLLIFLITMVLGVHASTPDTQIFYYNKKNREVKRKRATHYYRVVRNDSLGVYDLKSYTMAGILKWECTCLAESMDIIRWGKFNKKSKDVIKQLVPMGLVLHGKYRQYFQNGSLVCEKTYDNGLEMTFRKFYVNGQVMIEKLYADGYMKSYKVFYPNLVPKLFRLYEEGREVSFYSYYENGQVKIHREYNNGDIMLYSEYDEHGKVLKKVDQLPQYINGTIADAHRFIARSIRYPSDAQEGHVTGDVVVIADIDSSGDVKGTRIVRGVFPSLNDEACRVVKLLKFVPAESNNKKVDSELRFLIRFTLSNTI